MNIRPGTWNRGTLVFDLQWPRLRLWKTSLPFAHHDGRIIFGVPHDNIIMIIISIITKLAKLWFGIVDSAGIKLQWSVWSGMIILQTKSIDIIEQISRLPSWSYYYTKSFALIEYVSNLPAMI
jgi:hypothetical protein